MGNLDRDIKVDSVIMFLMIIGGIACVAFIGFELGKKKQCELDKDYLYEYDFGKCMKIGARNYK